MPCLGYGVRSGSLLTFLTPPVLFVLLRHTLVVPHPVLPLLNPVLPLNVQCGEIWRDEWAYVFLGASQGTFRNLIPPAFQGLSPC